MADPADIIEKGSDLNVDFGGLRQSEQTGKYGVYAGIGA
jgi:hypothetical protein